MIDWGNEVKPRPHSGQVGLDTVLKDARRGNLAAVKAHLKREPSLLLAKSGGHNRTFLWEATRGNQRKVVEYLLAAGADPNVPGRIRSEVVVLLKPYCVARHFGHNDLTGLLLEAGTVIDIYSACFLGDLKRVRRLLQANRSLLTEEQEDDSVWRVTPLHYALAGGHQKVVRLLIDAGAPVRKYTRLLSNTAVRMNHPELLPVLLDAGADKQLLKQWAVRTV